VTVEDRNPPSQWSFAVPSARRSLILCALGALIGLAIAGLGLFTAKGTRSSGVPAEDVALVNQVPILMSDYVLQLRALDDVSLSAATPAQKRKVLEDMIREELYVQRGIELGMQADTTEVRTALVGAVEAQSAADATMAQPTEADLQAYYQANREVFADEGSMVLDDHILPATATPRAIAAARAALVAGHGDAARERQAAPLSGKMAQGTEFYFAARIHLGNRLFAVARAMHPGEVSAPVALPDGVHLLVMKANKMPVPPPFELVRDRVLTAYVEAQTKLLTSANERFLRKRADIQTATGFE
jgi:hypothetical protein